MKLKIKAEPKDMITFCVFAFLWLIVVQLLVVNINAFVQEESFTFNIFEVYTDWVMFTIAFV